MTKLHAWILAAVAMGGACEKKKVADDQPAMSVVPPKKVDGPSVSPVITKSIAFVVPKASGWWGELAFPCYRAVMNLQPGTNVGEAFEKLSPNVPAAMTAGDIDIGKDVSAMGGFECSGEPCLYTALALRHPEKLGDVVRVMNNGTAPKTVGKDHYSFVVDGEKGPRTVHVLAVPIQWPAALPSDAWSQEAARATHVVFMAGFNGDVPAFDPLPLLADAQAAAARVTDAEGVLPDARGRCLVSVVGPRDFQPGFHLDRARFALAVPPAGKADPLMKLLDSSRTLDIETELALTPAPTDADATKWIADGRAFVGGIAAPLRAQFAGTPMMDAYIDMFALIGDRGFTHEVKGNALRLSWRTDRVPQSDLEEIEHRLGTAMGTH